MGHRSWPGISDDPSPNEVAFALDQFRLEAAAATALRPPTGRYNCHGLVFASRRAHIPPVGVDVDVCDLLRRDGYRPVGEGRAPQVGDVVAYRLDDEIEHTGFVSRVENLGDVPVVFVWSALGGPWRIRTSCTHESVQGHPGVLEACMIVTEATLREAALQLLASSTSKRYIREARRVATECGLVARIRDDAEQYAEAKTRATELLAQLDGQRERSRVEFETALLLCALSGTGSKDSSEILRQASRASSAWIRALAGVAVPA